MRLKLAPCGLCRPNESFYEINGCINGAVVGDVCISDHGSLFLLYLSPWRSRVLSLLARRIGAWEVKKLARRGQLIILDVLRIASWILGTSVPLKKGPSARGLQTVPHSKTGTRALLGPCAPAFRRCALRRRRRSRRRCCYTLSAACTRSALVRS